MRWLPAPDLQRQVVRIISRLGFSHLKPEQILLFRSFGSRSRARARIWGLPRIWQQGLKVKPHYCLEVLGEKFDCLGKEDQQKVLIHELLHIPTNFSGTLLPHRGRGKPIDRRTIERLFRQFKKNDNHSSR